MIQPVAAASYPPWVMLEHYCSKEVQGSSSSIGDTNTLVASRTTKGHPISVSLSLAAPPEGSRVCVQLPSGVEVSYSIALAAHDDSVLIQVAGINDKGFWSQNATTDHFVYNAGDAAADPPRPPSLLLLPTYGVTRARAGTRTYMDGDSAGLLRRGVDDEFVVAELSMVKVIEGQKRRTAAELVLLRSGCREWSVKQPPIRHFNDGTNLVFSAWNNDTVIPFGEQLCWVDLCQGLMFCDVFNENPLLRYLPLPREPCFGQTTCRNVCVTANGTTIKFVNIYPRCCCGHAGAANCRRSHNAYTVHTWTLRMEDMVWVMDMEGTLDATELWALEGYKGIPCVRPDYPVVSMEEPHIISFMVCEEYHEHDGDETLLLIMVDMRSKCLRTVFRYPEGRRYVGRQLLCPSRVSHYFRSEPVNNNDPNPAPAQPEPMATSLMSKSCVEIIKKQMYNNTEPVGQFPGESSSEAPIQASKAASPEAMILAALQEIPGLARDDMLNAFLILCHDYSAQQFRSLMLLPLDLRKDYVLKVIKASETCIICSACSANLPA